MKIRTLLLICACSATFTHAALSQSQPHATPGRLGYQDPKTGAFLPLAPTVADAGEAAPPVTPTTGKFAFNLNINIKSANIRTDVLACYATVTVSDNLTGSYTIDEDEASVAATITGSTAKCTVSIPYSWPLVTPTADIVTVSLSVYANSPTPGGQPTRIVTQTQPHISVPLNGSTTTYNVAVTM